MAASQNKQKLLLPIVVGIVLLVAAGYFLMGLLSSEKEEAGRDAAEAALAVASAGTTPAPTTPEDIARVLDEAKAANEKGQLVAPEGANAIELYLRVLAADPENRLARDALNELMPYATDRTDQYITEGNIPQAERALELLRKADPSSSVILTTLAGKIENLRRIQASRETEQQALLAEQQRVAQQRAQAAQVQPETTAPATPAPTAPEPATPAPSTVASTQPPPAAATPPRPAPAPALENRNFQLTRKVEATYPQRALRQRLEGWVELSFDITTSGDVTNVKVVNSLPKREFDREAIRALSQWKFRPRIEDGKAVTASARQRLEFKLGR